MDKNKIDNGKATGMTSFAAEEIRVLRRRNKLLEQEIEVMEGIYNSVSAIF